MSTLGMKNSGTGVWSLSPASDECLVEASEGRKSMRASSWFSLSDSEELSCDTRKLCPCEDEVENCDGLPECSGGSSSKSLTMLVSKLSFSPPSTSRHELSGACMGCRRGAMDLKKE